MATICKNALVTMPCGKAIGTSRITFNIPEEMQKTFPINELFKQEVIGFNVEKIDFSVGQGLNSVHFRCSIVNIPLLNAIITFHIDRIDYDNLKKFLEEHKEITKEEDEEIGLRFMKKIVENNFPIIQVSPTVNLK